MKSHDLVNHPEPAAKSYGNPGGFISPPYDVTCTEQEGRYQQLPAVTRWEEGGLVTAFFPRHRHKCLPSVRGITVWRVAPGGRRRGFKSETNMYLQHSNHVDPYRSQTNLTVSNLSCQGWGSRCRPPTLDTQPSKNWREKSALPRTVVSTLGCQGCQPPIPAYRVGRVCACAHTRMRKNRGCPLDTLDTRIAPPLFGEHKASLECLGVRGGRTPTPDTAIVQQVIGRVGGGDRDE